MNRKDELGIAGVIAAFALLVASTLVLLSALDELWRNRRLIYRVTGPFAALFGGNRDVPVLVFVGATVGWFLLFWIDATKRVQGALVFLVAAISVGPYLQRTERILAALGRTTWAFPIGLVGGIATGLLSARLIGADRPTGLAERVQWLRYPGAAAAFRHAATAVVGLTVVDYVRFPGGETGTPLVVTAGVVFVLSLSVFLQYGYERRVVAVSPPAAGEVEYQPYVLGGLYELASQRYGAFSTGRGDVGGLTNAHTSHSADQLPSFDDSVAFSFSSTRLLSVGNGPVGRVVRFLVPRPVTVESDGLTTSQIGVPDRPDGTNQIAVYGRYALRRLRHYVVGIVPATVRDRLPDRGRNTIDRLDGADTVLLIGPTPARDRDDTGWAASFSAVADRYADDPGTDVVLASVDAAAVADEDGFTLGDRAFKRRVASRMGIGSRALASTDIYPLDRFGDDGDVAFDDLLERLSE